MSGFLPLRLWLAMVSNRIRFPKCDSCNGKGECPYCVGGMGCKECLNDVDVGKCPDCAGLGYITTMEPTS